MHTPSKISHLQVAYLQPQLPPLSLSEGAHLIPNINTSRHETGYLCIGVQDGLCLLRKDEILRCEASGNYCIIHYGDGQSLICSKTLKVLERCLDSTLFVRIHQSHLVPIKEIRQVMKNHVLLRDNTRLPLSRHQKQSLIHRLHTLSVKV